MRIFDASEYAQAMEPPVFRHGGRQWTGALISIRRYRAHAHRFEQFPQLSLDAQLDAMEAYLREQFPSPTADDGQGPAMWDAALEALPLPAVYELTLDFFVSQAAAHGLAPAEDAAALLASLSLGKATTAPPSTTTPTPTTPPSTTDVRTASPTPSAAPGT